MLKLQYFGHLMQADDSLENSDAGKDRGQMEKRASEIEMAGWHHLCNEDELGQTPGDGEGQGCLVSCSLWGRRVGHDWVTEQLKTPTYFPLSLAVSKRREFSLPFSYNSELD